LGSLKAQLAPKSQPTTSTSRSKKTAPLLFNLDADEGEDKYLPQMQEENSPLTDQEREKLLRGIVGEKSKVH
jgi:hypothetical protein